MGLKEKLPGLRDEPGNRLRNTVVGVGYVFLVFVLIGMVTGGGEDVESSTSEGETDAADGEAEAQEESSDGDGGDGGADEGDSGTESNSEASQSSSGDDSSSTDAQDSDDTQSSEAATDGGETQTDTADESSQSDSTQSESNSQQGLTPADMETALINEGLDVYVMDAGDGTIEVDYYSYAANEQELAGDIGAIAGAYSALVDDGYETDEMVINVLEPNAEPVGEFRADADDAQAYQDGEITVEEYGQRVLATGEVYD